MDNINASKQSWENKTILIAEDTELNYKLIEIVVLKTKAKIIWAKNGQEAIDICKSNPDIDLVLMDIMMPEVDGFTATEEIKKIRKNLPVIAQTAFGNDIDKERLVKVGIDGFLEKPIRIDALKEILANFFNKS